MDLTNLETRKALVKERLQGLRTSDALMDGERPLRGFIISRHFVPATASRSLTMFKLLKNSSFRYTVISQLIPNNPWLYSEKSDLRSSNIEQLISTKDCDWDRLVSETFTDLDKVNDYDFFMSCVMPPTDHRIGLTIKKSHPSKYWIALWSDPVAYSPYANKAGDFKSPTENAKKDYENEVFKKADLLVFTNYHQMVYMLGKDLAKYRKKSIVVTHAFDPDYYPKEEVAVEKDRIVFGYVGHLDKFRNLYELAKGLKECKHREMFKVKIVGHVPEEQVDYLAQNELQDIFEIEGERSWGDALLEMKKCDFLVSMDPSYVNMDYSQQMSSKIADYLGTMKPILFMSYDKGISADIARETGNKLIPNRAEEISKFLSRIAVFGLWRPDYDSYQKYNSAYVSAAFDEEVRNRLLER